jgi:hypothetical protein
MTYMLIGHSDIQKWVNARKGRPAIRQVHDKMGRTEARLELSFESHVHVDERPGQDEGMSPCSWTAWLAELDRQHLALRVSDKALPAFEFVERGELN